MPYPIKKKRSHFGPAFLQSQLVRQALIFFHISDIVWCLIVHYYVMYVCVVYIMYLQVFICICLVGQQHQHQAAMRPPAAQPQVQVRAPPPARQDPYQGKGVSV